MTGYYVLNGDTQFIEKKNSDVILRCPNGRYIRIDRDTFQFLQWMENARSKIDVENFIKNSKKMHNPLLYLNTLISQEIIIETNDPDKTGRLMKYIPNKSKYTNFVSTVFVFTGLIGIFLSLRRIEGGFFSLGPGRFIEIKDYGFTITLLILTSLLHEISHGFMLYLFTSHLPKIKFGFSGPFSIIPSLKTDLSHTYILNKTPNTFIFLAGVLMDLFCLGILSEIFASHHEPYILLTIFALIIGIIMNLIPFWESDGYYLLTVILDESNLREKSVLELKKFLSTGHGINFWVLYGSIYLLLKFGFPVLIVYLSYKFWGIVALKISIFIFFIIFFYHFTVNFLRHINVKKRR